MKIRRFNEELVPEGWVNIKVDSQIFKRMEKYVVSMDKLLTSPKDKFNLDKKLEILSSIEDILTKKHKKSRNFGIQDKISLLIILQYLREIYKHFNSSSAGFLIEGFLATLIYGKLSPDFNKADFVSKYDELDVVRFKSEGSKSIAKDYQIKFYKENNNINVSWQPDRICDYYVICVKGNDGNIRVNILDGKNSESPNYIGNYAQSNKAENKKKALELGESEVNSNYVKVLRNKKYIVVKGSLLVNAMILKVSDIDSLILKCANYIQDSLKDVYDKLSELHYNIDSLVTGYDDERRKISVDEASLNCKKTLIDLDSNIKNLIANINKKET